MLHYFRIESVRPIWCNNCGQCTPESPTLAEEVVAPEGHSHWPHTEHNALKLLCTTNLMHKGKVTKTTFQFTLADRETTNQKASRYTLPHHAPSMDFYMQKFARFQVFTVYYKMPQDYMQYSIYGAWQKKYIHIYNTIHIVCALLILVYQLCTIHP